MFFSRRYYKRLLISIKLHNCLEINSLDLVISCTHLLRISQCVSSHGLSRGRVYSLVFTTLGCQIQKKKLKSPNYFYLFGGFRWPLLLSVTCISICLLTTHNRQTWLIENIQCTSNFALQSFDGPP